MMITKKFKNFKLNEDTRNISDVYESTYGNNPITFCKSLDIDIVTKYVDELVVSDDKETASEYVFNILITLEQHGLSDDLLDILHHDLKNYVDLYIDDPDDFDDIDEENEVMLDAAYEEDFITFKKAIADGADINYKTEEGDNVLSAAIYLENLEMVNYILSKGFILDDDLYNDLIYMVEITRGRVYMTQYKTFLTQFYKNKPKNTNKETKLSSERENTKPIYGLPSGVVYYIDEDLFNQLRKSGIVHKVLSYNPTTSKQKIEINEFCFSDTNIDKILDMIDDD